MNNHICHQKLLQENTSLDIIFKIKLIIIKYIVVLHLLLAYMKIVKKLFNNYSTNKKTWLAEISQKYNSSLTET